ncbi:MAG: cytochrome b [Rhodanobacter sp.]
MSIRDNSNRYGQVSRVLHWGIAILLLWQFSSAGAHFFLKGTSIEKFLWTTHKPLGFVLFVLILLRVAWALANLSRRPSAVSVAARLGHLVLYGILVIVPTLALLRQYGSGKPFEPFGISLFPGFEGDKIAWMTAPGNLLHGWLGLSLLALVAGHIFMVVWHKRSAADSDVLPRMWR